MRSDRVFERLFAILCLFGASFGYPLGYLWHPFGRRIRVHFEDLVQEGLRGAPGELFGAILGGF